MNDSKITKVNRDYWFILTMINRLMITFSNWSVPKLIALRAADRSREPERWEEIGSLASAIRSVSVTHGVSLFAAEVGGISCRDTY